VHDGPTWYMRSPPPTLFGNGSWRSLLFACLAVSIAACKHEPMIIPIEPVVVPPPPPPADPCDPDSVYFQQTILPLIVSSCAITGCHDAVTHEEDMTLTTYANIMASGIVQPGSPGNSSIMEVITTSDPENIMPQPPNEPLTQGQIDAISTWIAQGAQNNACDGACDTTFVTFSGTIVPLLTLKCMGCHSGGSPSGGLDFTTYGGVFTVAMDGRLLGSVSHDVGYTAMPPAGGMLPPCEIDEIRIWIEGGAPNN
jgi:hypothetical protein